MTHALAESLISSRKFDPQDMARGFAAKYASEPSKQKYYANVKELFALWEKTDFAGDIYGPAKERFGGTGSVGNGGGMRIAPVASFCGTDHRSLMKMARDSTMLTHSNILAVNGAILQAFAIHLALFHSCSLPVHVLEHLIDFCSSELENGLEDQPYLKKLQAAINMLQTGEYDSRVIVATLGNSVKAVESIPTAIYCALRALTPIPDIQVGNVLERTVTFAISMGGDTDTIATMAAAIVGALNGISQIPESFQRLCEGVDITIDLADQLHEIGVKGAQAKCSN